MEGYLAFGIEQFMESGFLETRATLLVDIVVVYLVLLPVLVGLSIFAAIRQYLKLHQVSQFLFFFLAFVASALLGYTLHFIESVDLLITKSSIGSFEITALMVVHSIIAVTMLIYWMFALSYAVSDYKRRALPGVYSESHAKTGRRVFLTIILTSVTTAALYWVLFVA